MRNALPIAGCCIALIAAVYWFFSPQPPAVDTRLTDKTPGTESRADTSNPFVPVEPTVATPAAIPKQAEASQAQEPAASAVQPTTPQADNTPDLRAYEIAADGQTWNKATYQYELERLRGNQPLLEALLLEFQNENDAARRKRLASLLGHFDNPAVLATLAEMIEGDTEARASAFDVLGRLQPNSPQARAMAIDKLRQSDEPSVQIGAMNALTTVAGSTSQSDRQSVQQRAIDLASSNEAAVRQRAVSTVGNWATDNSATAVLVQGLADSDPAVRRSAAYAFVDYPYTTSNAITVLLNRAEDDSEERRIRRAAALVLRTMQLTPDQVSRLNVAAVEMER